MAIISACTLDCPDLCSFVVDPDKRTVKGNPEHPFTRGVVCPKGARALKRIDAEERITTPLLRRGDDFVPVSWDEALDLCAQKINELRATPEGMLHVRGHGYRGVLGKASNVFFRALGSSATYGALCDDTGIEACIRDFGVLNHNDPDDLLNAARVINWGKDVRRSSLHTYMLLRRARENGTKVLTITPGGDATGEISDHTILIRPGTDRFLAAAVIRHLFETGGFDQNAADHSANFAAFRAMIETRSVAEYCALCDVDPGAVETLVEWYRGQGPTASIIGWGLQRYLYGGENMRLINALCLLAGQVGISGGGAYFNISSGRNLGKWDVLSSYEKRERPALLIQDLATEMRKRDKAGSPIRFVWIDGTNQVNQAPDSLAVARALRDPFVVSVDCFLHDTALRADLILPPALNLEREDILGSCLTNYINYSAKAVEPRGDCRSDFEILADLGARLDDPVRLPDPETCLRAGLAPSGVTLEELKVTGFAKVPHPPIAFEGLGFGHPDGNFHFSPTLSDEPARNPDFPLALLSLVRGRYEHSQIPEADQRGLPTVWISKHCPAWNVLDPEKDVYLETPIGAMQVRVETCDDLHLATVIIRRGGWLKFGHGANAVIQPMVTDMGHGTAYYSQVCRLRNAAP